MQFKIHNIKGLNDSTYVLRFDRHDMNFIPGQHLTLGLPGSYQNREYSIYSPLAEPYLEVLVKEVVTGDISKKLRRLKKGDEIKVDGPFGFFTLDTTNHPTKKYLFIATGTGIAPFHSITGSYPSIDYRILHGVRYSGEAYESESYPAERYVLCTSQDKDGDFAGRVTDYLKKFPVKKGTAIYLCGSTRMIYDVSDILFSQGFSHDDIKTEVYF